LGILGQRARYSEMESERMSPYFSSTRQVSFLINHSSRFSYDLFLPYARARVMTLLLLIFGTHCQSQHIEEARMPVPKFHQHVSFCRWLLQSVDSYVTFDV
jgi:hypothetical protein